MDLKIINYYFIGYPERSNSFKFYCPSYTTRIIETGTTRFIEDGENNRSGEPYNVVLEKKRESFSITVTPKDILYEHVQSEIVEHQ